MLSFKFGYGLETKSLYDYITDYITFYEQVEAFFVWVIDVIYWSTTANAVTRLYFTYF